MLLVVDMVQPAIRTVTTVDIECKFKAQTCCATTESTGRRIRLNSSKQPHSPPWQSPLKILAQSVYFCWSVQFVTTCCICVVKELPSYCPPFGFSFRCPNSRVVCRMAVDATRAQPPTRDSDVKSPLSYFKCTHSLFVPIVGAV